MKSQLQYNRYLKFIDSLKGQAIDGYCEVHHIVPKSLGGDNSKSNLVKLTARQHYIAHWMLWKALGGVAGRSFFMMSNFGKYGKVNSKTYDLARKDYSEQVVIQMSNKPNVPEFTPEHRRKLSIAKKGRKLSAETKEKLRQCALGRKLSKETKMKISNTKKQAYLKWVSEGNTPSPASN